ncbi:MAG TPA: D-aminoacyl-tRNA deacylase [Planctomycetota bacterium]|jgi:D-tyrosyl-tRNA(Tyr) deacylase|nr:D-aminoacyl-tRNA deacylase [Planctomycetota bacterium]
MRAVVQRVRHAQVVVGTEVVARIGPGLLVLVGFEEGDGPGVCRWLAKKLWELRIFEDTAGLMNVSLAEIKGACLLVSQFTLLGDASKGRRPSFVRALPRGEALPLMEQLATMMRGLGCETATGAFGEHMEVSLLNDGPVTILLDRSEARV